MHAYAKWIALASPLVLLVKCSSSGAVATAPLPPAPPDLPQPAGVSFTDVNPAKRTIEGTIKVRRAADETDVTEYRIYWGTAGAAKLDRLATLPKTAADLSFAVAPGTLPPNEATRFLVFTANAAREATAYAAVTPIDNYPRFVDVSAGLLSYSDSMDPSPVLDVANRKIMVVANDSSGGAAKPVWIRCGLENLVSCTYTYSTDTQPINTGLQLASVLDAANSKVLSVTQGPGLHRCNLDASGCTFTDISAGQVRGSGVNPSAAIDAANGKVLVVTDNYVNDEKPSLFRCDLDGTNCTHTDLSAGQGPYCGQKPSAIVDAVNAKLLVATRNYANEGKPSLFRCNLDGTACAYVDISAGHVAYSGDSPSAVIDVAGGRLLVVTEDTSNGDRLALFRCKLDGTECTHTDISAGQAPQSGWYPSAVVDAVNAKLLVVAQDGGNQSRLSLYRCELDGTSCTFTDISAGQQQARYPRAIVDAANGQLLVTASMLNGTAAVFTIGLW